MMSASCQLPSLQTYAFAASNDMLSNVASQRHLDHRRFPIITSEPFEFHEEYFINAVVMPSYRNYDQPTHYYVAEIR
ncbi:unnamed protein product [Protopolystoma xenopodis]|uniref:Uncharacterized protein n=1 Tax=Protopolystoma xenopodis TaxID=117903 RepID=A0A3S5B0D1_9PLAT|nr:unnamed protein product [Protopolystoma xenopodis]